MPSGERPVGRPRRDPADVLRTMAWCCAVRGRSHLGLRELARALGGGSAAAWVRYKRGSATPSDQRVAELDSLYPGTARYFAAPLWHLLRPQVFSLIELRLAFEWLDEPLKSQFVVADAKPRTMLWRRATLPREDFGVILSPPASSHSALNRATALAALSHEAVLRQDRVRLRMSHDAWNRCIDWLAEDDVLFCVPSSQFRGFGKWIGSIHGHAP